MNRLAKVSLIFIAMIVALAIGGVVYADGPPVSIEGVTINVNGAKVPVYLGAEVYSPNPSTLTPGRSCTMPATEIIIDGSSGIQGVTLTLDRNCVFAVSEIRRAVPQAQGNLLHDISEIRYEGWAKSELNDVPGIDLATVRASIEYTDFGDYLTAASGADANCTAFWPTGWRVSSCTEEWTANSSAVYVKGVGVFRNIIFQGMNH